MTKILITGASAGIGRETALALLGRGHHVFIAARRTAALAAVRDEARDLPGTCEIVELDVTSPASVERALVQVGDVDVLVNNAGFATAGPMLELDDAALQAQFDTNLFGLMRVTRAFGERMVARGAGRIINVGSVSGRIPAPMLGAYHATKYALEAITDALRMELHPFGVHVSIVEPGTIRTEFADVAFGEIERARKSTTRYQAIYDRQVALARRFDRIASPPAVVARALVRVIEARRPRARVVVPGRFLLLIGAIKLLPVRLVDAVMRRVAGLDQLRTASLNASGGATQGPLSPTPQGIRTSTPSGLRQ